MRGSGSRVWVLVIAAVLALSAGGLCACGDDDATMGGDAGIDDGAVSDAPLPMGATARFSPSAAASDEMAFGDVPFPSDLYLGDDGRVALANLPIAGASSPALDALLELVRTQSGFCVLCGVHLYIDGALDPATVPATSSAEASSPIVMIDADPSSPDHGELVPVDVQYRASAGLVTVRPTLGTSLRPLTRYAVALTTALHGADGGPLAPSDAFRAVRDTSDTTDPAVARARAIVGPALDELAAAGVPRDSVVSVASFTTADPSVTPLAIRAAVRAAAAPVAAVDVVYPNASMTLDDLLGVPAEPVFGMDVPEAGGVEGERGLLHETTSRIVVGHFDAPRFVTGTGTDLGVVSRGADGLPTPTGTTPIPFVLIVPMGVDVTRLPVVVFGHGSPRTMEDALAIADTVGSAGIAVLGFDQYQHGARSPSAVDALTVRGRAGSDGFFEADRTTVQARVLALMGTPPGMEVAVPYLEGTYSQVLADALSVVRFAREGDLSALGDAEPTLAGLAFDPDRIYYAGNSFGTFEGGMLVAVEPELSAILLNVPGGSFAETIVGAARTRSVVDTVGLSLFGIRGTIDDVTRKLLFEPMLDMIEWAVQGVDPRAVAPRAYAEPLVAGPRPDLLLQIAELDDFLPMWGAQSLARAFGAERIGPFDFVPAVNEATRPVSGNLATPEGAATVVAHLYEGAAHVMIGYARSDVLFEAPIAPPFHPLAEPRLVDNPTTELHLEFVASSRRAPRTAVPSWSDRAPIAQRTGSDPFAARGRTPRMAASATGWIAASTRSSASSARASSGVSRFA